ncbi:MAG: VWA domain-containing protein [Candidatus Velthaea sp.]
MIDAAAIASGFSRALRGRGLLPGMRRTGTFADVLTVMPPGGTSDLYWRARTSMLGDIDDVAQFNAAFLDYFSAFGDADALAKLVQMVDASPPARAPDAPQRESIPPPPSELPADERSAERAPIQFIAASLEERLRERAFEDLDERERAIMNRLIARVRVAAEYRASRRRRPHAAGDRFDFRRTLRGATRTAGELFERRTTRRRERLRPLVFLVDVSGSMAPFARALIQYARVSAVARPGVRAFAFATELSDLTPLLRRASNDRVMAAVGAAMRDYGGGTRIGFALHRFNAHFAQRGAARGGTVVILSDGWERDDPELVRREMERLRRLTRRIVWVNPHKRHPAYEPLARGMAAALPYLDAFVSGHNLRTLEAVADAIEGRTHDNR